MTGGDVLLQGGAGRDLEAAMAVLRQAGAEVEAGPDGIRVRRGSGPIRPVRVDTAPHPGFPTDLQASLMA